MSNPPSPRRCFQFRLRTLIIVVTLLAVPLGYFGWQAKIVRERKVFFDAHCLGSFLADEDAIPWLRRRLGDTPYSILVLPLDSSRELRSQAAALFPEARIMANNPKWSMGLSRIDDSPYLPFPDKETPSTPR